MMQTFDDNRTVWLLVCAGMKDKFSDTTFNLWFGDMSLLRLSDTEAVFIQPSELKRSIVRSRYMDILKESLRGVLGFDVAIRIIEKDGAPDDAPEEEEAEEEPEELSGNAPEEIEEESDEGEDTAPRRKVQDYTFDNFVVGTSNTLAHAASLAVSNDPASPESPNDAYNPLFIYGPSGVGKTHLLCAITNNVRKNKANAEIIYTKGEEFTNKLVDALSKKTTAEFREKYRGADVLIIDDIQFIAGKVGIQEELFHTLNFLFEENKQIVLASDRHPNEIKPLEDRLRTRFQQSLIVDIQPPDIELRMAIIKLKSEAMKIALPNEVITYVADRLKDNVRQLEGAIKKIGAQSFLMGTTPSIEIARNAIGEMLTDAEPTNIITDKIFYVVTKKYAVTIEQIKGQSRKEEIALARNVCNYLLRSLTDMTLVNIGKIFSREYTTVMSSCKKIEKDISQNPSFESEVNELISEIKG